jgi:hypothetical protein
LISVYVFSHASSQELTAKKAELAKTFRVSPVTYFTAAIQNHQLDKAMKELNGLTLPIEISLCESWLPFCISQ